MKIEIIRIIGVIIIVLVFSFFVYPTRYLYIHTDSGEVMRVDRFSGKTEIISAGEWKVITKEFGK